MKDYSKLGLNERLVKKGSLRDKQPPYRLSLDWDVQEEQKPFIEKKIIYQSGGTVNNPVMGTPSITGGTWNNGVFGTPQITGGTIDNVTFGTVNTEGGTINNPVIGTPTITGGTSISHTIFSAIIGTPQITEGTADNMVFGTPAITSGTITDTTINNGTLGTPIITNGTTSNPTVTGTSLWDVNAGSAALGANGNIAIQTFGTAGILAWRVGGTTFWINPTGTI